MSLYNDEISDKRLGGGLGHARVLTKRLAIMTLNPEDIFHKMAAHTRFSDTQGRSSPK